MAERSTAALLARARVPLGFFCAAAVVWIARPTPASLVAGAGVALVGEAVRFWAAGHLEKGREVTRSGPYRLTRHPLYLGSAIIALGAAIASAHVAASAVIAAYVGTTLGAAIQHEEANMRAAFGRQYDEYLQSRGGPVDRPFSLARAIKNREHKTVAGLALYAAILAAKAALG